MHEGNNVAGLIMVLLVLVGSGIAIFILFNGNPEDIMWAWREPDPLPRRARHHHDNSERGE